MIVGVWRHHASVSELHERLRVVRPEEIVTTLDEVLTRCDELSIDTLAPRTKPASKPAVVAATGDGHDTAGNEAEANAG